MSHVSKPCEFAMDCMTPDGETCPTYADPDNCNKYRRKLIAEGEISLAGWEFNNFNSKDFAEFWLRVEQEWAEQFKKAYAYYGLYGPPCDCGSSVCDECNPGWDQEPLFEEDEEVYY